MPEWKRVRLDESGHEVSVQNVTDGMTVIDKPATDRLNRPLPPNYEKAAKAAVQEFKGAALDDALDKAGLSKAGSADEKRVRLADHQASVAARGGEVPTIGGESATSEEDSK